MLAGFAGLMYVDNNFRQERKASDRCWIDGGTYTDGTCTKPEDRLTDQEKVCMAMKGTYITSKEEGAEFTCYSWDGAVKTMPNLEGKKVVVMDDGTVMLVTK